MTADLSTNDRRLRVLFAVTLLGVLGTVGAFLSVVAGGTAALVYAVVVTLAVLALAGRARRLEQAARARAAGSTCSCCTSTQHDPVKVV